MVYFVYLAATRHWRHVVLRPDDIGGVWPMVRHYIGLGAEPNLRQAYNPLQGFQVHALSIVGKHRGQACESRGNNAAIDLVQGQEPRR